MSTPNKYQPETNTPVPPPRCPHCSTDLPEIGTYQWNKHLSGQALAMIFCVYCTNPECRKVISTQTFFVQTGESAIVPPN